MRNTDIVIANNGIRPMGDVSENAVNKARAYIQSNYIKRELKEHYNTDLRVAELQKAVPHKKFLGSEDFCNFVSDRIDNIRSVSRIAKINSYVEEMEYVKAIREILR